MNGQRAGDPCRRISREGPTLFAGKACIGDMWEPPANDEEFAGEGVAICDVCGAIGETQRPE